MGCTGSRPQPDQDAALPEASKAEQQAEDLGDEDALAPLPTSKIYAKRGRRESVSAEVKSFSITAAEAKNLRKSLNTEDNISGALQHCFLFTELDDEQRRDVMGAMFKRPVLAGELVLREGEAGDNLYVIQSGTFEAVKELGAAEKVLFTYEGAGAFGELALMYNCPRAATVRAVTDGILWAMDRSTFRTIVLAARVQKRARYEQVLQDMEIFQSLSPAKRSSIADCLMAEQYQEGEYI